MTVMSGTESSNGPILVLISGPIAAGKSSIARALTERLRAVGEQVALVELDRIAEMALPTLPDWSAAHTIFNSVVGQWLSTPLTVVVAEGPGSKAEVGALIGAIPRNTLVVVSVLTSSFTVALERANTDPSRGISRERPFLSAEFARWASEMPKMDHDVVIDTGTTSIEDSVCLLLEKMYKVRDTGVAGK